MRAGGGLPAQDRLPFEAPESGLGCAALSLSRRPRPASCFATGTARDCPSGFTNVRVPLGAPTPGELWNWEYSPDSWGEGEILLRGIRLGIEVIPL